jgi:hypothetical protein
MVSDSTVHEHSTTAQRPCAAGANLEPIPVGGSKDGCRFRVHGDLTF